MNESYGWMEETGSPGAGLSSYGRRVATSIVYWEPQNGAPEPVIYLVEILVDKIVGSLTKWWRTRQTSGAGGNLLSKQVSRATTGKVRKDSECSR